jgi:hypothetical protein
MPNLKSIDIPFIDAVNCDSLPYDIATVLNTLPKNAIANAPWTNYPDKPECAFAIAHGNNCIFLKFFITEDHLLVRFTQPNDWVFQDSCVEIFVAFNDNVGYYNIEFNSIGTCYFGYSRGRDDIGAADIELVKKIKSSTLLYNEGDKIKWELTVIVPTEVFYLHPNLALAGQSYRANFYKCGDDLPVPHYLTWNNIESAEPNFHLPEFFGELNFK